MADRAWLRVRPDRGGNHLVELQDAFMQSERTVDQVLEGKRDLLIACQRMACSDFGQIYAMLFP